MSVVNIIPNFVHCFDCFEKMPQIRNQLFGRRFNGPGVGNGSACGVIALMAMSIDSITKTHNSHKIRVICHCNYYSHMKPLVTG